MREVTVEQVVDHFNMEVIAGGDYLNRKITRSKAHRPGLEFVGFFDYFPTKRVQVLGKKEITFLHRLSNEERDLHIGNIVKYHPPCFIITTMHDDLTYLRKYCAQENIPLLRIDHNTTEFISKLDAYLVKSLAEEMTVHGVCVNVSGIGVLLRGRSGIGKSETAHTLILRGHKLVADDIIVLKKLSAHTLLGTHDGTTKELLALRSIGLINVVRMYGRKSFQEETRIVLDIELTQWQDNALYNELELEDKFTDYMGVKIPHIEIQLQPGRDVAGLIEAAANNWFLKQQGYSAVEEFMKRLDF